MNSQGMLKLTEPSHRDDYGEVLSLDDLLVDISVRYINQDIDQIDSRIETDLGLVCQSLDIDFATLWQWADNKQQSLLLTHLYSVPEGPVRPDKIDALESFPWTVSKMLEGETLVVVTDDMVPEAARDQEVRRYYGAMSAVVVPLLVEGGRLLGVLSFDVLTDSFPWSADIVKRLQLVGQIFCSALIRKESEVKLRESERRLELAADAANAGLWELDCDTNMFWATEKALEIFGYDSGAKISLAHFETSILPADLGAVRQAIESSMKHDERLDVQYRIRKDHNSLRWIHSRGQTYFKSNGEPERILGTSIDITERKAREKRIIESEARLTSAMDIAGIGFYEMREGRRAHILDDKMKEILGITSQNDREGRQFWLEHIHPEDLSYVKEQSRLVLDEGKDIFEDEYRYMHPELGEIWIHHHSRVIKRTAAGEVSYLIGVMRDITRSKQMEESLRKSEMTLRYSQRDLQKLAARLISIREKEFKGLARELHDDFTQRLAVLAIDLGKLEIQMNSEEVSAYEVAKGITETKMEVISISEDIHRISRQLHPTILDDLGLVRAIESECAVLMSIEDIEIAFSANVRDRLPDDVSLCLYRIIQEGLHNVVKHSGVKECEVNLKRIGSSISLTIKDKGWGFEPAQVRDKPGLGLASMRERAQLVGGDFFIETEPGQGTTIHAILPLQRNEK